MNHRVQLRTSEHPIDVHYVRLSMIDVQLRTSEHRSDVQLRTSEHHRMYSLRTLASICTHTADIIRSLRS